MLEQTISRNTIQERAYRSSGRIKSIRVTYQFNEHFLRNILRRDPAIAHSEDKPVDVGLPPTIERNESLFVARTHQIHKSLVTQMGARIHPSLFNISYSMSFLLVFQTGEARSSKICSDLPIVNENLEIGMGHRHTKWIPEWPAGMTV
jgi:hypothetical protein